MEPPIIPKAEISPDYLSDESRLTGAADSLSFPENERELIVTVTRMARDGIPMTVQGTRTGITGGAVSFGGHILNLSRMNKIRGLVYDETNGSFTVIVEPGLTLADLGERLSKKDFDETLFDDTSKRAFAQFRKAGEFFFPPDPTETTASLGGMAACNASGAKSFRYGPMRNHVRALRLLSAGGETFSLERGQNMTSGRAFALTLDNGKTLEGSLPEYDIPNVKNAAGYYAGENIDLLDLFIGQEGTLALIAGLHLKLTPKPPADIGVLFFFAQEGKALDFVKAVRRKTGGVVFAFALEFFDAGALALVRRTAPDNIPAPDARHQAAVYVEAEGADEDSLFDYFETLSAAVGELGEDPEANWIGTDKEEREKLLRFRHAVPEAVNTEIARARKADPSITKLGSDFAVPEERLDALLERYRLAFQEHGFTSAIFGHIGDNHLHANIIPRSGEEYRKGKEVFIEIARDVIAMGGTISAEHGVGKLKKNFLRLMYGDTGITHMKRVKGVFDPKGLLNPGNLFDL